MGINPFNETNLQSLLKQINDVISIFTTPLLTRIYNFSCYLKKIGKNYITIMIVPHSEKKIVNLHMPVFKIFLIFSILISAIIAASIKIADFNFILKDVSKLTRYGEGSDLQLKKYREEINILYNRFQKLKPEISSLHTLVFKDTNSLWAKGGPTTGGNPAFSGETDIPEWLSIEMPYPSIEELNIRELGQELKTANKVLYDIVDSLKTKKIIENTPSIFPVKGYILCKSAIKTSPYMYNDKVHKGIEIAAFPGSAIRTPAPGNVEDISWDHTFGLSITIRHKYGFSSIFSHCQDVIVKKGQELSKGEIIAHVGKSGMTSKHICYYQIKIGTEFTDPLPFVYKR